MSKQEIIEAILSHVISARKSGADKMYFDALTGRDKSVDWETIGDLVDELIAKS
jgi:hypothetical protein